MVGRRATLTLTQDDWGDAAPHSQLVVIGAAGSVDGDSLNLRMKSCLAVNAPKSELENVTRTVMVWLRQRLPGTA